MTPIIRETFLKSRRGGVYLCLFEGWGLGVELGENVRRRENVMGWHPLQRVLLDSQ